MGWSLDNRDSGELSGLAHMWGHREWTGVYEVASPDPESAGTLIVTSQPLELGEISSARYKPAYGTV